jgi:hypothetical protein
VLTTIPKNDDKEEEEDEEDECYKGEAKSNDGKSIGSFVCEGPEFTTTVGGNRHVHVVMNNNFQEEMMATIFTGLTSYLAFFMTFFLVLSVSLFMSISINEFV